MANSDNVISALDHPLSTVPAFESSLGGVYVGIGQVFGLSSWVSLVSQPDFGKVPRCDVSVMHLFAKASFSPGQARTPPHRTQARAKLAYSTITLMDKFQSGPREFTRTTLASGKGKT